MPDSRACHKLQEELGRLFACADQAEYWRIQTPYLYPDGDNIDLFCKAKGDVVKVTDLAETTGWLRMQSASPRRSLRQTRLIEDTCVTHGVEFNRGMLEARCGPGDDLAQVVTRVAQAALRVSDLWFTLRTRAVQGIVDEVAEFMADRKFRFDRGKQLVGRSGRNRTIDFHVRTELRTSFVQVLTTGNRAAAQSVCNRVLSTWFDLNHLAKGPKAVEFVSLFDDTAEVWGKEDYSLVEPISTVSRWSRPDEFAAVLSPAAQASPPIPRNTGLGD